MTLGPAFARPHQVFIIGERAGMFAREGGKIPYTARRLAWMPGHLLHPLLRAVSTVPRPHRLRLLATQAPWLDNDPLSPDGWGVQMPQAYGDRPWAERVFGESPVRARYQARLDYIRDHVELLPSTADRYSRHIEIGGWQDFYNENSSQFLSFALACGKSVTDPFTARGVIDATLAVPATERHQDGARSKYIIERLLRERVPAYPASAVKDPIKVPFVEYYRSGPLMHVWDHYDIPEFFVGADRTRLLERPGLPVWNALTWAIWQDRIVQNASLRPLPSSIDRSWEVHPDRVSA